MTNPTFTESDLKTTAIGDGVFDYQIADQIAQVRKNAEGTWDLHFGSEIIPGYTRKQAAKEAGISSMLATLNKSVEDITGVQTGETAQITQVEEENQNKANTEEISPEKKERTTKASEASIAVNPETMQTHEDQSGQFTISVVTNTGTKMVSKRIYQTAKQVHHASKRYLAHWRKEGGIRMKQWVAT